MRGCSHVAGMQSASTSAAKAGKQSQVNLSEEPPSVIGRHDTARLSASRCVSSGLTLRLGGIPLEVVLVDGLERRPRLCSCTRAQLCYVDHRGANWAEAICHSLGRWGSLFTAMGSQLRRPHRVARRHMHLEAVPQRLRWELKIERPILLGHSDGALPSPALRQSLCSQCPWYNIYIVVERSAVAAITH
jgi:hypothetical protein